VRKSMGRWDVARPLAVAAAVVVGAAGGALADLPASYAKADAVDCDKFAEPTVVTEGDEVSYRFDSDPKYRNACGMANAAAALWGSGYRKVKDAGGNPKDAADLREFFEWVCDDYAAMVGGGDDPYPGMGLAQQIAYMNRYTSDPKTSTNPNENPRRKADGHANVADGANYPLTGQQQNEVKQKLHDCSMVSLILRGEGGLAHETQMAGWAEDGTFRIYDPDTDRAVWDDENQTWTFEDMEFWTSSLTDDRWRLTSESGETFDVIGYKTFAIPAPGAAVLGLIGLGMIGRVRKRFG